MRRRPYLLLLAFMYGLLFQLSNPALPDYMLLLQIPDQFIGLYLASAGLGLFVFSTLWGAIGDIKDRDKVLGVIFIGFGIGQLLFGIFRTPYTLLFAALFSGIFFAGILVNLYSFINDTFIEEHERNKMLSHAVSLYLLGGAIAYVVGGVLADVLSPNYHLVFIIQAGLLFLFGLYVFFSKIDLVDTDHHLTRVYFWNVFKQIFHLPWIPIYTVTLTFFISFSHNNVKRFLDLYVIEKGYSPTQLGIVVFLAGIVGLISNVFIAPYFLRRMHNFRFLQIQFFIAPLLLLFVFRTTNLYLGLLTYYMGYTLVLSIYEPTAISFMSDNKAISQGVLVGVRQSIVGLGMTIGFVIGGYLYAIDQLFVFYLAILFYVIVFIGFSVLVMVQYKAVKEYRQNYLKEVQ